jgi:hypothetical protein
MGMAKLLGDTAMDGSGQISPFPGGGQARWIAGSGDFPGAR